MKKVLLIVVRKKKAIYILAFAAAIILIAAIVTGIAISISKSNKAALTAFLTVNDGQKEDNENKTGKLAIIIDDFGRSRKGVNEMMAIDRHLTFAVMPFLENSRSDAEMGHKKGYEIIVHLAMEPNQGKASWLGPKPIMSGMNESSVKEIVTEAFESVPYAVGANIHMGSKASSEEPVIAGVLDVIHMKNLYFVDSLTSGKRVPRKLAKEIGVKCYERDVFLDGQQPLSYVKKKLREAGDVALKKGNAVAIGHVGVEGGEITAQAISEMLPEFDSRNIRLVFVSELDD